jgi:epsilon-lactone hydrolase
MVTIPKEPELMVRAMDSEGTLHVPSFEMPFSSFASRESRDASLVHHQAEVRWQQGGSRDSSLDGIEDLRRAVDDAFTLPLLRKQRERWQRHVDVKITKVNGVTTQIFSPKDGATFSNQDRVLINVHGGGFLIGGRTMSEVESLPIAALGKIKIVSVDYRMYPEYRYPAATEDLAAVYEGLLGEYRPENVGIYGSSAGAILTAQSIPWFIEHDLPLPGALGMFAGTGQYGGGDSGVLSKRIFSATFQTGHENSPEPSLSVALPYFEGAELQSSLVSPMLWTEVLQKFPPSLLITGTRAHEMSAVIDAHNKLTAAGALSRLHLWDGLGHCFFLNSDLPESHEVERIIIDFFSGNLGRGN